ncbi:hypothetical protein AVEN_202276-1 [Araneus ventricosus]|uniref:Uncharacterized protein n=1 Tax=Araneus ventricosus TaxID=182803 RepID=A0A4Y2LCF8_ARAVE|nr:hypothetical protein AVEN_109710-1 [Araneus ventricosus]GBN11350.1 hypothetical protein AVEN_202276-1 [Araneus ventricosus]
MSVGDRTGCLNTCHLSESSLDVSGVPYHANCTRPIPSQRFHQIEQSPDDKQGLWINDLSPYSYTCIRPIQLETRLVGRGNVFPVVNSPMVVLSDPREE